MPRIEMLREQLMVSRLRLRKLQRQVDETKALQARKHQQLQAALTRRAERLVDADLGGAP